MKNNDTMSLGSHLLELRKRLIFVIISIIVFSSIAFVFSENIIKELISLSKGYSFIYNTPEALMVQRLKIAIIAGIVVSSPVILLNIWLFISPALKIIEKFIISIIFTFGVVLFFAGAVFAYYYIIPFVLDFFIKSNSISVVKSYVTLDGYISLIVSFFIAFGMVFEIPVILLCLDIAGIVQRKTFVKLRKFVIIIICIISAIITPPDVFSLVITAVPMLALFEISLVFMFIYEKITHKKQLT